MVSPAIETTCGATLVLPTPFIAEPYSVTYTDTYIHTDRQIDRQTHSFFFIIPDCQRFRKIFHDLRHASRWSLTEE